GGGARISSIFFSSSFAIPKTSANLQNITLKEKFKIIIIWQYCRTKRFLDISSGNLALIDFVDNAKTIA
ncbi:hypothetical protein, partial [Helicobacter cinaedi]|uniref:hypothetical protein n=1 Tax=Helicobacter cinaedi TaxID=213 RepID=UPI001A9F6410